VDGSGAFLHQEGTSLETDQRVVTTQFRAIDKTKDGAEMPEMLGNQKKYKR